MINEFYLGKHINLKDSWSEHLTLLWAASVKNRDLAGILTVVTG